MNYKIIQDEEKLKEFINWLPDLEPNEKYYCCLFARKKYYPVLKTDKAQLKRYISTKELLLSKIKQLECEEGLYTIDGISIPNEALALYINPNPRNMEMAAKKTIHDLVDKIGEPYPAYNPHSIVLNNIQTSSTNREFIDFDFDNVNLEDTVTKILESINKEALTIIQTRGGFHALVKPDLVEINFKNKWYKNIMNMNGCDVRGDNLLPVVGCNQGGFVPKFIKL